jgi:hypothetical protein
MHALMIVSDEKKQLEGPIDDDVLVVMTTPPYTNKKLQQVPTSVFVCPLGHPNDQRGLVLHMSLEEAETLSNRLALMVSRAKEGEFSMIADDVIAELRLNFEHNGDGDRPLSPDE